MANYTHTCGILHMHEQATVHEYTTTSKAIIKECQLFIYL